MNFFFFDWDPTTHSNPLLGYAHGTSRNRINGNELQQTNGLIYQIRNSCERPRRQSVGTG